MKRAIPFGDPLAMTVGAAIAGGGLLLTGTLLVAAIRTGEVGLIGAFAIGAIFTALALAALLCLRGPPVQIPGGSAASTDAPQVTRGKVASPFSCSSRSRVLYEK